VTAQTAIFLDPTAGDAATVTGLGTIAPAMPASAVLDEAPGTRCRWTATASAGLKLDLGGIDWDMIALIAHTAGPADTLRIRADADEADVDGGAATVDVNNRSFWPPSGKPARRDVFHSFYRHPTVLSLRWLRLDFSLAAAPFEIQRVMVGKAFQPAINIAWGYGAGYQATGLKDRSVGGHAWGTKGRPLSVRDMTFAALTEAEKFDNLDPILRNRGAEGDWFVCIDPAADARLADMMLWGTVEDPGIGTIQFTDHWQHQLKFVERAP
jgi:hypothetical protein